MCIREIARARGGVMRGWLLIRKGSLHTENHLLMIRVVNRDTRMAFTCGTHGKTRQDGAYCPQAAQDI